MVHGWLHLEKLLLSFCKYSKQICMCCTTEYLLLGSLDATDQNSLNAICHSVVFIWNVISLSLSSCVVVFSLLLMMYNY